MTHVWFVADEFDYGTLRFRNAAQYIRLMHPEYCFVLTLKSKAVHHWGCTRDQAITIQSDMLAEICAQEKKHDLERGLTIVIQDESCPEDFGTELDCRES
jgi:hypothetical protein